MSDDDVVRYQRQLSAILDYFQKLEELDTSHIDPTSSVLPLTNVMRADVAGAALSVDEAIANAPDSDGAQFRVRAVLDELARVPRAVSASVRVALIQARPVYYDLDADRGQSAVADPRGGIGQGARLAAFPETFFPGYPAWLDYAVDYARWDHPPTKRLYARLAANSMAIDSARTAAAARRGAGA